MPHGRADSQLLCLSANSDIDTSFGYHEISVETHEYKLHDTLSGAISGH